MVGDISFQKMYGLYGLKHHRHSRGCSFLKLVVLLKKLALSLIVPDHLWQVVNDIAQGMEKLPLLHHSWTSPVEEIVISVAYVYPCNLSSAK